MEFNLSTLQAVVANGTTQPTAPAPTIAVEILESCSQFSGASSPPIVQTDYTYSASPPQAASSVIVRQPVTRSGEPVKLGPKSSRVTCPECGERLKTKMVYTASNKTHIFAVALGILGFPCCLCTIPYLINNCKTGHHFCSNCEHFLGSYNPD